MKIQELRKKNEIERNQILLERRKRADDLRGFVREKKVKNVKELREVKKDIARILTLQREEARSHT